VTFKQAAGLALAACLLMAGCATRGPLLESTGGAVELADTPFFPQLDHQCGPAALATVLGASGVAATPETLTPLVYLPGRRGSLQIEMQAAPRGFDRISYTLAPNLDAITAELDAGRPVLVLHNYGLPIWPRWHYAVVVGYDPATQKLLLRSGRKQRQQLSARNFMRAWDNGGRWAIVMLKPGDLPAQADRRTYLAAASAFERVAKPASAQQAFDAAVRTWPGDAFAWIGRGTAQYRAGKLPEATADYRQALNIDSSLAGARNNLAMTLLDQGCPAAARREIDRIDAGALSGAMRDAVQDTRTQIEASSGTEAASCPGS
jgi:tetratricopeptide (TPR) repeat protein